jgi:hypothetical protein
MEWARKWNGRVNDNACMNKNKMRALYTIKNYKLQHIANMVVGGEHGSHQHLQNIAKSTSFLADHIYTPEMILTSWFNLSFVSMTVAMVFYGIAMHQTMAHHAFIELITIGLISLSIYYTYNGYMQYDEKLQHATNVCVSDKVCSNVNMEQIKNNQKNVRLISAATVIISLLIAILIIYKSYKKFTSSSRG